MKPGCMNFENNVKATRESVFFEVAYRETGDYQLSHIKKLYLVTLVINYAVSHLISGIKIIDFSYAKLIGSNV